MKKPSHCDFSDRASNLVIGLSANQTERSLTHSQPVYTTAEPRQRLNPDSYRLHVADIQESMTNNMAVLDPTEQHSERPLRLVARKRNWKDHAGFMLLD